MESLIIHWHTIFDEEQPPTASYVSSPPLPPAPLGEIAPPHAYGSAHTKFSEHGTQHRFDAPLPQTPTPQATGDDFTPQLPLRPPASIHPSSRGNAGSSNGHSNTSPILTTAETNVSSPTSYIPPPPLPLRPGRQSALTSIQSLRGTQGLDFSQPDISGKDWSPPASPSLSDPPSSPLPALKSPQVPPPPPSSALPRSTLAHQPQQPILPQTLTQDQPQPKAQPPLLAVEGMGVGGLESVSTPLEAPLSSTVDSTDNSSRPTPDPPGPILQPLISRPLTQQVHQIPIQVTEALDQSQRSPIHSLRQTGEAPRDRRESQGEAPPSQLQ